MKPDLDPHTEALMVKVTDGTATPAEREELMALAVADPALRRELEAHLALKAVTDGWVERLQVDLVEDEHARSPLARAEMTVGAALLLGGVALLAGWGLVELWAEPDVPLAIKLGYGAVVAGLAVLLVGAVRWRLKVRSADRYTEVIR